MKPKALLILFFPMMTQVNAQHIFPPELAPRSIMATHTSETIKIDGKLDEAIWGKVERWTGFTQVEPNQGIPSRFNTFVQVLYDNKYLHIGAFCEDPDGKKGIRVPELARDFSFRTNDTFAVGIDGFLNQRNTVTFATNPYGAQKDYLSFDDTFFDMEWNGLWKVRTSITDNGWYAEFRIPWKTLRYGKEGSQNTEWGINFVRQRRKSNEISAWSPYPRAFGFNRAEYFGRLVKVIAPRPGTNIQVNPYALVEFNKARNSSAPEQSSEEVRLGGDLKWAINSNTLLDVTLNTDFAQAEADRQVNNISRFSIFFPERRQFFLENASLFGQGLYSSAGFSGNLTIAPFFSRRIGLSTDGSQIPIDGGLRWVHQSNGRSIGLLGIKDRGTESNGPSYNFVGRYVSNFGKQNRIGVLGTLRQTSENTNLVTGVDGFFRMHRSHSLAYQILGTHDTSENSTGIGGYAQYRYDSNTFNAWMTQALLTENFNPALGFVSRENIISNSSGLILNYRGRKLPFQHIFRAFMPRLESNWFIESSSGQLLEREINLSPFWLEAQNGAFLNFSTIFSFQHILESLTILYEPIEREKYRYTRYQIGLGSDPSSRVSANMNYQFGDFYNGRLKSWNLSITTVPMPNIFLRTGLNSNSYTGLGFSESSDTINLLTIEGRLFLNPRVELSGLYQKNGLTSSEFYNIRFAWEYSPLSYFFVVLNSNRTMMESTYSTEDQAIIKLSFLKQF